MSYPKNNLHLLLFSGLEKTQLPCQSLQFDFIQCSEVSKVMILDSPL